MSVFSYLCCIVVVFIPCCGCFVYFNVGCKNLIFDAHPGARHFWRAFASTFENWRENSKISFFHYLRSLRDSLTQFWILNFYFLFFKNCSCFFTSNFLNWGTVTLFALFKLSNFSVQKQISKQRRLWKLFAKPNLFLSLPRELPMLVHVYVWQAWVCCVGVHAHTKFSS